VDATQAAAANLEFTFVSGSDDEIDKRAVRSTSERLQRFLLHELELLDGRGSRDTVMESYLGAPVV
jgi:hypothetical protein